MALSDLTVRKATATGKDRSIADFDGLYLFVPVQGRKAWHFRYYYVGKRERFSLGTYPEVSLREARDLRDEARALLAKGINPRNERKRKRQAIVLADADTFMAVYKSGSLIVSFRSMSAAKAAMNRFNGYSRRTFFMRWAI